MRISIDCTMWRLRYSLYANREMPVCSILHYMNKCVVQFYIQTLLGEWRRIT
jgi:hypothetical protein